MTKLQPCPYCESTKAYLRELDGGPGIGVDGHYAYCPKCQMSGPFGDEDEATLGWNMISARVLSSQAHKLRAIIAPLIKHADRDDYAPPYMINVQQCRKIKEQINA